MAVASGEKPYEGKAKVAIRPVADAMVQNERMPLRAATIFLARSAFLSSLRDGLASAELKRNPPRSLWNF